MGCGLNSVLTFVVILLFASCMFIIATCLCSHSTSVCIMQMLHVALYLQQKLYYCFLITFSLKGDMISYHASLSSKHTPCTTVTLRYQKLDGIIL